MQIRLGCAADAPTAHAIVERAYDVYVEQIGGRPAPMDDDYAEKALEGQLFVAEENDLGVVGLIVLASKPDHLLIENVAVDPHHQGTGIGRALLAHAEIYARRHQVRTLRLYTNAVMTKNLALYAHLGYTEDSRRSDGGFERVYLSKNLNPSDTSG